MDTRAFLEALWPAEGIFCLAKPFQKEGMKTPVYAHRTYGSIDAALADIRKERSDLFFCVHTLKEPKVWNPAKMNPVTGERGAFEIRSHVNMLEGRCFFFDLDVGESTPVTPKYDTRQDALDGLEQFLFRTGLPDPLITSSGGGFHVYWRLTDAIPSLDWRAQAAILHLLARRHGLRADPARTTDQSSVLRVVGTMNCKPNREPRPCVALQAGVETDTATFLALLRTQLGSEPAPTPPQQARKPAPTGNLAKVWDGPTRTLDEVAEVCEHVRSYAKLGHTRGGEPIFYNIGCGLIPFLENGEELAHDLAAHHPEYDPDVAAMKIEQWPGGPVSCATIDSKCGGDACSSCKFSGLGVNPLAIATKLIKSRVKPPPRAGEGEPPVPELIIDPPFPYSRTEDGIRQVITKTVQGAEIEENVIICPYDLYPYAACDRTELEQAFSMWAVDIPLVGLRTFKIPSSALQDTKVLHQTLIDHGVYVSTKQVGKVQDLMHAWLRSVQEKAQATRQFDHLGWVDDDKAEFILPTAVIGRDGVAKPSTLSGIAKSNTTFIRQAGTLDEQLELMKFYDRPEYVKHQFMIMCALGAPLFHATGLSGVVVNASGESGGSKSTALYTGAGFWGRPKSYVINGTSSGATKLARAEMVHTLANLPVFIDELTGLEPKEGHDLVMSSTQEGQRIRLNRNGAQQAVRGGFKSTMILCSANSSLHHLLSVDNRAGVAGNMRVFEIFFPKLHGGKDGADEYLMGINANYGHIGPQFLMDYMRDQATYDAAVRHEEGVFARQFNLAPPERFWSGAMSAGLTAGLLAKRSGLLPFDVEAVRDWLIREQLPAMRGLVDAEEREASPITLLAAFLNDNATNIIRVVPSMQRDAPNYVDFEPRGKLVAHSDMALKVIHVRKDSFRDWCEARFKNGLKIMRDMEQAGLIFDVDRKRVLGHGTRFGTGRTVCFSVDMTNPEFGDMAAPSKVVPLRPEAQPLKEAGNE